MTEPTTERADAETTADWHRRVIGRSLRTATQRSIDRGQALVRAAATVLERSGGVDLTVQDVADEAGQSLRTLYQYFESKDDLLLAVFEESMRTYAQLIERAISKLDDPLDRLVGAVIAATSMSEYSVADLDRGLARLRLRLADTSPELVGRSQEALSTLVRSLVADATAAERIRVSDLDGATFLLLSVNAAFITSERLGNDSGVPRPTSDTLVTFCLRGLGAEVDDADLARIREVLRMPKASRAPTSTDPGPSRAAATGKGKARPAAT